MDFLSLLGDTAWITAIGTLIHHLVDAAISMTIIKSIEKGTNLKLSALGEQKRNTAA